MPLTNKSFLFLRYALIYKYSSAAAEEKGRPASRLAVRTDQKPGMCEQARNSLSFAPYARGTFGSRAPFSVSVGNCSYFKAFVSI
jgi:hypothetical protein